jgi:hypothetical protein
MARNWLLWTIYQILILLVMMLSITTPTADLTVYPTISEVAEKAAGIYVHPELHQQNFSVSVFTRLNRTILVSAFNIGYLNHISNFKCFIDRLDLKFFLIALEPLAYNASLHLGPNVYSYYHNATILHGVDPKSLENAFYYREENFNLISVLKLEVVLELMILGYDIVFIDSDVAVVRDPIPYMLVDGVDYVYTINVFCPICYLWDFYRSTRVEGNTGVYSIRSNYKTIFLWKQVLSEATRRPTVDDQTVFWLIIRANHSMNTALSNCSEAIPANSQDTIVNCPLDGCQFSMGGARPERYRDLSANLKKRNESLVLVHANFVNGNGAKYAGLLYHGFWISNFPEPGCKIYNGTL